MPSIITTFIASYAAPLRAQCFISAPLRTLDEVVVYHDWHVQPVVKDRSALPLRAAFSVEPEPRSALFRVLDSCFSPAPHEAAPVRSKPFKLTASRRVLS